MKGNTKRVQPFHRAECISDTQMGQAIADWLDSKCYELSSTTMRGYCSKAKLIDKHFKRRDPSSIKPRCVREFLQKLLHRGYSNKTINEYLIVLRGVFQRLLEDEEISKDPSKFVGNMKTASGEPDPFTRDEIAKITSVQTVLKSEMALLKLGIYTGLRVSELLALAWEDVDLDAGTLRVRRARVNGKLKSPKNRASNRLIGLSKTAIDLLASLKPVSAGVRLKRTYHVKQEDNRRDVRERLRIVFLNSNTGGPIKTDAHYSRYFLQPLLKEAGVRYRPPNNGRHTWASQMLTEGIPAAYIAAQLGHSSEQMLYKHYGKLIREDMPKFVEQQDRIFAAVA